MKGNYTQIIPSISLGFLSVCCTIDRLQMGMSKDTSTLKVIKETGVHGDGCDSGGGDDAPIVTLDRIL